MVVARLGLTWRVRSSRRVPNTMAGIRWYNTGRISLTLQGLSPMEYRTQALAV